MNYSEVPPIAPEVLRDCNFLFVHGEIDDLGLNPYEFRVYAHLARRAGKGECYPGIQSIADKCRMNRKTVRDAISHLMTYGMVTKKERPGTTPKYRLTESKEWKKDLIPKPTPPVIGPPPHPSRNRSNHPSRNRSTTPPVIGPRSTSTQVHPVEVNPTVEASPPSEHVTFRVGWCSRFEQVHGFAYAFNGPKEGAIINKLLANNKANELLEIAEKAWRSKDEFVRNMSISIGSFYSQINRIKVAVKGTAAAPAAWERVMAQSPTYREA